jgi:hypothetical protein
MRQQTSVEKVGVPAELRTSHLPNGSPDCGFLDWCQFEITSHSTTGSTDVRTPCSKIAK